MSPRDILQSCIDKGGYAKLLSETEFRGQKPISATVELMSPRNDIPGLVVLLKVTLEASEGDENASSIGMGKYVQHWACQLLFESRDFYDQCEHIGRLLKLRYESSVQGMQLAVRK